MNPDVTPQASTSAAGVDPRGAAASPMAETLHESSEKSRETRRKLQSVVCLPPAETRKSVKRSNKASQNANEMASGSQVVENTDEIDPMDVTLQEGSRHEEKQQQTLNEIASAIDVAATAVDKYVKNFEQAIESIADNEKRREAYENYAKNPLVYMHYQNVSHLATTVKQLINPEERTPYAQIVTENIENIRRAAEVAKEHKSPPAKRIREDTLPNAAKFKLVMAPKPSASEDPIAIYLKVTEKERLQLAEMRPKGREARFLFYTREHAECAMTKLQTSKYKNIKITDMYTIFITVAASHSIRTQKLTKVERDEQPFMKNGVFEHAQARKTILEKNPLWFESHHDIECVEMHTIPGKEDRFLFEIYVSGRALRKFGSKTKEGRGPINLGSKVVDAYLTEKDDYCFKCLSHKHWWKQCDAPEPRCKYCVDNHLSKDCPIKHLPKEHVCRNCSKANEMRDADREEDSNHPATSTKCPFIRERMRQERRRKQAKRTKPKYVRGRK